MALNIDKIKSRLASFEKKSQSKEIIWKPELPSQVIRIVPLQKDPTDPFIHLKFHYDLNDRTYLSPASFNKPDPFAELAEHVKKEGNAAKDKEMWKRGRNLEPKLRTYVPIIVRGEESKGVRFWGFGVKLYTQLMQIMNDVDYGPDVTSLTEGYDFTVFYKSAKEVNKDLPEISFQPKPKPRPAIDPNDANAKMLLDLITTKQPDLLSVWEVPTYEVLEELLAEQLRKSKSVLDQPQDSNVQLPTEAATSPVAVAQVNSTPTNKETVVSTPASVVSPSAAKATATPTTTQDLTKVFDELFNSPE